MKGSIKDRIVKAIAVGMGIVLLLVFSVFLAYRFTAIQSLPTTKGTLSVQGISEPVEIIRDDFGIPHIFASNEADLYFAWGYAMAQDRLWQMDFFRRLGQGRLSEVFGNDFVSADRYFRTLTAGSPQKTFSDAMHANVRAFADGINAYMQKPGRGLPVEFKLMRYKPEKWHWYDTMAIFKVIAWQLSFGWKVDLAAAKIHQKIGSQKFREAFASPGRKSVHEPTPAGGIAGSLLSDINRMRQRIESMTGAGPISASNNWVVSGRKTVSGKPLLANDTHMGLSNPSLWWEVHLVCPGLDVSGFAIPGMPVIPVGHNRRVSWGITTVMADDVDFFIEKINPANSGQYRYKDSWEDFRIITETIRIKGNPPETLEIRVGRNGPVIETAGSKDKTRVITSRWVFNERPHPGLAAYLLIRAGNLDEVIAALRHWEIPGQNFVFADIDGNIGFWSCAAIPLRKHGDGLLPVPGWTGQYDWQGYLSFGERPHTINPAEGFVATANHDINRSSDSSYIPGYYASEDRVRRINQMLAEKSLIKIEDFRRMHRDIFSPMAEDIVPTLVRVMNQELSGEKNRRITELLSSWDFRMGADSPAAAIFEMIYIKLLKNIFADEMGDKLYNEYLDMVVFAPQALRSIFQNGFSAWVDNISTPAEENLNEIILQSVQDAVIELHRLLGPAVNRWRWDRLHRLTFRHVMGRRPFLDRLFNLGPYPEGGSALTVNKLQYDYRAPFDVTDGVSQRMIADLSDLSRSLHVLPTGQSGLLESPHYKDQISLYRKGQYHPVWTDPQQLKQHTKARLKLLPKAD